MAKNETSNLVKGTRIGTDTGRNKHQPSGEIMNKKEGWQYNLVRLWKVLKVCLWSVQFFRVALLQLLSGLWEAEGNVFSPLIYKCILKVCLQIFQCNNKVDHYLFLTLH